MKRNVGAADRGARIVVGVALLSALVLVDSQARWWGLLGLIPLLSGLLGACPMYALFGLSTCPLAKPKM